MKRVENGYIFLDKNLTYVDDREIDEDDSMEMEIDDQYNNKNEEIMINWLSIAMVHETILPFPIDDDRNYLWKAKPKPNLHELYFKGHGVGFKPGMNLGPYNSQ